MFQDVFEKQRLKSRALRSSTAEDRRAKLRRLAVVLEQNQDRIVAALASDFGKPAAESVLTEIYPILHEIHVATKRLGSWMRPRAVGSRLMYLGTRSWLQPEPKGVCLIISPWNYPFQLALCPLVAAIAAGNTVLLKPSELTPACSALKKELLAQVFEEDEVFVALGAVEVSTALMKLPVDHIFFTGSTPVGKIVMEAAAKIPCEVTLELGGKSPALVEESADLALAAEKIAWGKWINGGQTCVAPDYVLVPKSREKEFEAEFKRALSKFASGSAETDQALIVTKRHRDRLEKLAAPHEKIESLQGRANERAFGLQVLRDPPLTSEVMSDEIFGPILPWITYETLDQAIEIIHSKPQPLAFYAFTRDSEAKRKLLREIPAGGVCINDVVIHLGQSELPFGGIGPSGLGRYHGDFGFKTFSHEKPVLERRWGGWILSVIYPPYTPFKLKLLKLIAKLGL